MAYMLAPWLSNSFHAVEDAVETIQAADPIKRDKEKALRETVESAISLIMSDEIYHASRSSAGCVHQQLGFRFRV